MKMIVGLGNPGPKYETTRHNVGWLALDRLIDEWKAIGPQTKDHGMIWQAQVKGEKVLLVKPLTYMNSSGKCVAPIYNFHKLNPTDLVVIHDEMDLAPLSLRLKLGGGPGGHNGLKSIDQFLGGSATGYHRVRLGVGHPRTVNSPMDPADYVLAPFSNDEWPGLDPLFRDVQKAVEWIIEGNHLKAMNTFNVSPKPAAKK